MTQDLTGGYCPKCDTVWEMSVKELKLIGSNYDMYVEIELDCFKIIIEEAVMYLDRSQVYLLILYLQEHLK